MEVLQATPKVLGVLVVFILTAMDVSTIFFTAESKTRTRTCGMNDDGEQYACLLAKLDARFKYYS